MRNQKTDKTQKTQDQRQRRKGLFLSTLYFLLSTLVLVWFLLPQTVALAYTITATAGPGGSISPSGAVSVNEGEDITFTITPNGGYVVANILVDGSSHGAASTFTFYSVKFDVSITVSFLPKANSIAETIYVDNALASDCLAGNYSVANRDSSGNDGNAYNTIQEAANVAGSGDTVLIRAGTYSRQGSSPGDTDVLWPKHSGTPANPIVFKPYNGEEVILGDGLESYPSDGWPSIARGVISLRNVGYIVIEGLKIRHVAGWLFARNCHHITIKNCWFEEALYGAKGTARFVESHHNKIVNNTYIHSSFDSLQLIASNYNLVENNYFDIAEHALLAIRAGNYNVIRNNTLRNPWIRADGMAEKLVEVYDWKLDTRDSRNPAYLHPPQYDSTKYNLFENNFFGYHPYWPDHGAQPSAIQFSGQNTLIRNNIFSNPPVPNPHPAYESRIAGGIGLAFRWGGSWEGWVWLPGPQIYTIVGEGHEAGFVYGNRIYNNVFNGYDNGQVSVPSDTAVNNLPTYAPMENVENYEDYPFEYTWKFGDNLFKNNIFYEGNIVPHISWGHLTYTQGTPTQIISVGAINNIPFFENNNFFATGRYNNNSIPNVTDWLIYNHALYPYQPSKTPAFYNQNHPDKFVANIQKDPGFVDPDNEDFVLNQNSEMIDAGTFLTKTVGSGSGNQIQVEDAGYFYDGYGIEGEAGDTIQLAGQTTRARIVDINYETDTLTLNQSLTWTAGQGVSLAYSGNGPDIGAYEYTLLPLAVIQNEPKQGYLPLTVSFDGSQSKSPHGDIVSYEWTFGDGATSQEKETSHTYTSPGEYTVTLKVTDIQGYKGKAQTHIVVLKKEKEFGELPPGCYNNVFNPTKGEKALIVVELPKQAHVRLNLYNTRGNKVRELADEEKEADVYKYYWDGKDDSGDVVGSGLYFVHIQAGDYKKTKKIVVIK